ncbi:MAG: pyridoxal phosphate-dependent aminotransferase [candidate division KSB1 bacterium]|nr:pyridoxal phosphate-dependent aminotransferase [candidate division KSB1 bacterium]
MQPNRLSLLLEEKRRRDEKVFDLTESNPTAAGFDYPAEAILHALAQPAALRYEPQPRGLLSAREAVAEYYRQRGHDVNVDRIHLTTGTSEAYTFLFKLLADSGQNVLVPQPSYPLFDFLAGFEGIELVPYRLFYAQDEWRIDFDSIYAAINEQTRAIILVNPNNPTGSFVKRDELANLTRLYAEHRLPLIVDEVFSDYAFSPDSTRVESLVGVSEPLTFVMSGLSKILGLPQMKLGWIVVNGPENSCRQAQEYLDLLADTQLSVSTPIQHAAPKWLQFKDILQNQISARVKANFNFLQTQLVDHPRCRALRAEGGWYAVLEIDKLSSEEEFILAVLKNDNVLVHPGYFFDFQTEGFLVLSLLPAPEIFREGFGRLLQQISI